MNVDGTNGLQAPPAEESGQSHAQKSLRLFCAIVALNVAGMLWLYVRTGTSSYIGVIMDFFLHAAIGGIVIYLAFRILFAFPFRTLDLLLIVLTLSLGLKVTLNMLQSLSVMGVIAPGFVSLEHAGGVFQACLFSASMLLAGGAMGLRHCVMLRLERRWPRALNVSCGMLALPAAAGLVTFPILILRDIVMPESAARITHVLAVLWLGSILVSLVNITNFLKTMTLESVIDARQKMP